MRITPPFPLHKEDPPMRSLLRLLALLLSVSLIAAACGDDDPVEEADDAAESTDAAEPSDD